VMQYLARMNWILKPAGLVLTTMFLLNDQTLTHVESNAAKVSFEHRLPSYEQCRFTDPDVPEGAVAYFEDSYLLMLHTSGFELKSPIQYGQWSGVGGSDADRQDYIIFGKSLRH
jgi:hypothetical protein